MMYDTIEQDKLADRAESQLLARVLDGRLLPGQRVVEAEVARQMGISRAPLREAIRKLETRGILVNLPRKGVFVRSYSARDVRQVATFRLCLEKFAVEWIATSKDPSVLNRVQTLVQNFARSFDAHDLVGILDANLAFHLGLVELVGNERLTAAFKHLAAELRLIHSLSGAARDSSFLNRTIYDDLASAILNGHEAKAAREITRLIAGFERKALAGLQGSSSQPHAAGPAA